MRGIRSKKIEIADEDCATQESCLLCLFFLDCDDQRKRDIRGEEEMKAI